MASRGISKSELGLWLVFFAFWGLMLALNLRLQEHDSAAILLMFLIVPLVLGLLAPQMVFYGLIAFLSNVALCWLRLPARLGISAAMVLAIAFITPHFLNQEDRASVAAAKAQDVKALPQPGAASIAFLLPKDAESQAGATDRCGSYCQRLLYTGEATTVLVGVIPDVAPSQFDMSKVPVTAYARAMGKSCAAEGLSSGSDSQEPSRRQYEPIESSVVARSEAGECLISRQARLDEAQLLILERKPVTDDSERNTRLSLRRIEVYQAEGGQWRLTSRKTYGDFVPAVTPMLFWLKRDESFEVGRFGHDQGYEQLNRLSYLRQSTGLKFEAPSAATPEKLRGLVERALQQGVTYKTKENPGFVDQGRIADYVKGLANSEATPEDIRLLRQIIQNRTIGDGSLWGLEMAVKRMGPKAADLAPDLLKEMKDLNARDQEGRLGAFSGAFAALPKEVQAQYFPELTALAQDQTRHAHGWRAITRLGNAPAPKVLLMFTEMLQSDEYNTRRIGEIGVCMLGAGALPAKDMILERAVSDKGGKALLVSVYRIGLFDVYKQRREAMTGRTRVEQHNDNNTFRFLKRRIQNDEKYGRDPCQS